MQLPKASFLLIILGCVVLLASYIAFIYPTLNTLLFLVIVTSVAIGAFIKTEFAALAVIYELCLGGHGYLFSLPVFNYSLSIRVALFLILLLSWLFWRVRINKKPEIFSQRYSRLFVVFGLLVIAGFIYGVVANGFRLAFFDANAYFALLYIPIFFDVWTSFRGKQRLLTVLYSGAITLAIFTIVLLGIFSIFHYDPSLKGAASVDDKILSELSNPASTASVLLQRTNLPPEKLVLHPEEITKTKPISYRWLRDTGIGQISYIDARFFRVFLPSQIVVAAFFCFYSAYAIYLTRKKILPWLIPWALLGTAIVISLSRSLWLGCFFAALLYIGILARRAFSAKKKITSLLAIFLILGLVFLAITSFPVLKNRITTVFAPQKEVAATHRIELLKAISAKWKQKPIVGSGFGSTVTFPTVFPNGQVAEITFYVYEWAYFDTAVKIGAIGLLIFLCLCAWIPVTSIRHFTKIQSPELLGSALAGTMLCAANITTPVLIHPLGLGMIAVYYLFSTFYKNEKNPSTSSHLE